MPEQVTEQGWIRSLHRFPSGDIIFVFRSDDSASSVSIVRQRDPDWDYVKSQLDKGYTRAEITADPLRNLANVRNATKISFLYGGHLPLRRLVLE